MANDRTRCYPVTPVITNNAYADGDAFGAVFEIAKAGQSGGIVNSITIVDLAGQKKTLDLILFSAEPATKTADNAAFALAEADAAKVLGTIQIADTDYINLGSDAMATVNAKAVNFTGTPSGKLWGQFVIRAAGTYAANAVRVSIGIISD